MCLLNVIDIQQAGSVHILITFHSIHQHCFRPLFFNIDMVVCSDYGCPICLLATMATLKGQTCCNLREQQQIEKNVNATKAKNK